MNFFYPYYYFYFSEQVYWAKDLIFLVTEHEQLGAQAWLQAYHRTQSGAGVLNHGDLEGRAGAIQVRDSFYCKVIRVFSWITGRQAFFPLGLFSFLFCKINYFMLNCTSFTSFIYITMFCLDIVNGWNFILILQFWFLD